MYMTVNVDKAMSEKPVSTIQRIQTTWDIQIRTHKVFIRMQGFNSL